jgi:hypothetical protein
MSDSTPDPPKFGDYQLKRKPYGGPPDTLADRLRHGWRAYALIAWVLVSAAVALLAGGWYGLWVAGVGVVSVVVLWIFGPEGDDAREE